MDIEKPTIADKSLLTGEVFPEIEPSLKADCRGRLEELGRVDFRGFKGLDQGLFYGDLDPRRLGMGLYRDDEVPEEIKKGWRSHSATVPELGQFVGENIMERLTQKTVADIIENLGTLQTEYGAILNYVANPTRETEARLMSDVRDTHRNHIFGGGLVMDPKGLMARYDALRKGEYRLHNFISEEVLSAMLDYHLFRGGGPGAGSERPLVYPGVHWTKRFREHQIPFILDSYRIILDGHYSYFSEKNKQ